MYTARERERGRRRKTETNASFTSRIYTRRYGNGYYTRSFLLLYTIIICTLNRLLYFTVNTLTCTLRTPSCPLFKCEFRASINLKSMYTFLDVLQIFTSRRFQCATWSIFQNTLYYTIFFKGFKHDVCIHVYENKHCSQV